MHFALFRSLHACASTRRPNFLQLSSSCRRFISSNACTPSAPLREPFRIVFMGRDDFSCEIFNAVYNARDVWQEIHIATNTDAKSGHKTVVSPLRILGEELGLPVTLLAHSKSCWRTYTPPSSITPETQPTALLIAASFGKIIPTRILEAFPKYQRLNVHGSIVPVLRGPAPVQWAIMEGMNETGASVIELAPVKQGVDTGPCFAIEPVPILSTDTHNTLRHKIAQTGGQLLVRVLRDMLAGTACPQEQNHFQATHAPAILSSHALVDWEIWDATRVDRTHRAIAHQRPLLTSIPFGSNGSVRLLDIESLPERTTVDEVLREPGEAVFEPREGYLRVRCAGGTEVAVRRLQTANRAALDARNWWNGVPKRVLRDGKVLQLGEDDDMAANDVDI